MPTWVSVGVRGTWHNMDGTPKTGAVLFTIPTRVVDSTGKVIFAGGSKRVTLDAAGSLAVSFPANDDPDIFPHLWSVEVAEKLSDGSGRTYLIYPSTALAAGGIDLADVVVPSATITAAEPFLTRGEPGGLALLDADGDLIDAGRVKVLPVTVGTTAGTVAAGDDTRITGAATALSLTAEAVTARAAESAALQRASNLSDLANPAAARTALGAAPPVDLQVFTVDGMWTRPPSGTITEVICIGPGGGGGSGRRGGWGTVRSGGGGGGAGGAVRFLRPTDALPATVAVTVGLGGAGGASVLVDNTDGSSGGGGTTSSAFGSGNSGAKAGGGAGGGIGSTPGGSSGNLAWSGAGAATPAGGLAGSAAAVSVLCACGGGSGGGITAADATSAGGIGSGPTGGWGSGSPGAANGGNGGSQAGSQAWWGGAGGGGGGSASMVPAGAGGNGAAYGGGGGGGGASANGQPSGAGGRGGDGLVVVITR